ncbi:MAG: EAL domain-containing protein [Pseudomonadota bacterium]
MFNFKVLSNVARSLLEDQFLWWSLALFFALGALLSAKSVHDEITLDMRDDIHEAGKIVDEVAGEVTTVLLQADFLEEPPCSAAGLVELRRIVLESIHIRDIGIFTDDVMVCTTSLGVLATPFSGEPPDYRLKFNFNAWLSPNLVGSGLLQAVVLKRGQSNVVLDPRHFQSIPDSRNYRTAVYLVPTTLEPVVVSGSLPSSIELGDATLGFESSVQWLDGYYVASRCSRGFEACVVSARLILTELFARAPLMIAHGLSSAIGAFVLLIILAIQIERHRFGVERLKREASSGHLMLHYQPIVNLTDGKIVGAESLVRIDDSGLTPRNSSTVLDWVNSRLASDFLASFVIERTLEEMQPFLLRSPENFVSVNLELDDVQADGFVEYLVAICREHGIAHKQLLIEITEREDWHKDNGFEQLAKLRHLGFSIAVDDFGTGYANLSLVGHPHVDIIKIDRLLMVYCIHNDVVMEVVKSVSEAVTKVDKKIVVEGIETEEQMAFLREHLPQCLVQGYLLGKPSPVQSLTWQENA